MRSQGRLEPSRAVQREFWRLIAVGVTTVVASADVGVSGDSPEDNHADDAGQHFPADPTQRTPPASRPTTVA